MKQFGNKSHCFKTGLAPDHRTFQCDTKVRNLLDEHEGATTGC